MITDNELRISNQSYTNKDFYQIYPELLELVSKITEIWDPSSSNESDPGVVILKLLAFLADKHNYNIDKNILECFPTSCTQEDSMRKLCDMMGYDMHYFRSASTNVSMMWTGAPLKKLEDNIPNDYIWIPAFTTLTDDTGSVSYVTTEDVALHYINEVKSVPCIEGKFDYVKINSDNIVKTANIDSNNRFYLPEISIAENGIWIKDATVNSYNQQVGDFWKRVTNLNIQQPHQKVWKFGYDSRKKLPYIQFPEDFAELMTNGLYISYVRTSGVNGNIKAKTLVKLQAVTEVEYSDGTKYPVEENNQSLLIIQNPSATNNGADFETLDEAYNNFKKTVGTFDTLVTCRDYANAIYNMLNNDVDVNPLVSNCQVSDIRDDINKANKIVTFDDYGIVYEDISEVTGSGEEAHDEISHFDLYVYPLNPIRSSYNQNTYQSSFKPNTNQWFEIKQQLNDYKTVSHVIKHVNTLKNSQDLYLIKNYYKLKARIATTHKVTKFEGQQIINNIATAIYKKFNARNIEYGEEIPYDIILSTLQDADSRIKVVSLEEPEIETKFMLGDGSECSATSEGQLGITYKNNYRKAVVKNVLAGKLPLFNYDTRFEYNLGQTNINNENSIYGNKENFPYHADHSRPLSTDISSGHSISYLTTELKIYSIDDTIKTTLAKNECVQLIAPNLRTVITYPMYVNYFFSWKHKTSAGYIEENTEYQLQDSNGVQDILYINYTDSTDKVLNYEYRGDGTIWLNGQLQSRNNLNIIKPNFRLYDSEDWIPAGTGRSYSKKSGFREEWGLPGMISLTASDEIAIRDVVKTKLEVPTYCYWITNNQNILKFDVNGEYILDEGEYFFFTDENKTTLSTLGSGTKLSYQPNAEWKLSNTSQVDLDEVAEKGIAAYADTDWQYKKDISKDKPLDIAEMQIINLTENDSFEWVNPVRLDSDNTDIDVIYLNNNWYRMKNPQDFTYNDNHLTDFNIPGNYFNWSIRSRLNISVGPSLTQTLKNTYSENDEDVAVKEQLFTFIRSGWYFDNNGDHYYYNPGEIGWHPDSIEDVLSDLDSEMIAGTVDGVDVRCNHVFEKLGGELVPIKIYNSDGTEKDDASFYQFKQDTVTGWQGTGESGSEWISTSLAINSYDKRYTKISLDTYDVVELPVFIPKDSFGLLMIYCTTGTSVKPTIWGYDKNHSTNDLTDDTATRTLAFYKDMAWTDASGQSWQESLTLEEGLNVIQIKEGTHLFIASEGALGNITIGNIDIVTSNGVSEEGQPSVVDSGINYKLLNITNESDYTCDDFLRTLQAVNGSEKFYYNVPVASSNQLDVDSMADPYSWFNYNNVCNKFVIGEIDPDFSDIQIVKGSMID